MADVDVVSVRVKPNLKTFRTELRAELRSIDTDLKVNVGLGLDKGSVRRIQTEIDGVAARTPSATIKVDANPAQFRAAMDELVAGTRLKNVRIDADVLAAQEKLDRLTKDRFVLIDSDLQIAQAEAELNALTSKKRRINVDAQASFSAFEAKLVELTRPRTVDVQVDVQTDKVAELRNVLGKVQTVVGHVRTGFDALRRSGQSMVDTSAQVLTATLALGIAFSKLTIATAAVSQLVLAVGTLAGGLGQIAPIAIALPGLFAGFGLALATVKLGADGIKKAFEGMKPAVDRLQGAVDATFRKALAPSIVQARALLPELTAGFKGVAVSVSSFAASLVQSIKAQGGVSTINSLLSATAKITRDLGLAFGPVVVALLNIADIGLSALQPLTDGIGDGARRFAEFTKSAEGAAKIKGMFVDAQGALRGLGNVLSDVGSIASGVFKAMNVANGTTLGGIKELTGGIRDFVQSAQGQDALITFFASLRTVVIAVSPIIATLASIIGTTLAPVIADIATAIGPSLNGIFQALGSALQAAAPGIEALATGFAGFLDSLRPALPLLGEVASTLGSTLADALTTIAPSFVQLIQDIAPSLPGLASAIGKVAGAGIKLLDAFAPILGPLGEVAGLLADALVPVFDQLKPIIGPVATALGSALADAIGKLAPILPPLVTAFVTFTSTLADALLPILPGLLSILPPIAAAFILMTPAVLALAVPFILTTGAAVALAQVLSGDLSGAIETTKSTFKQSADIMTTVSQTNWGQMAQDVLDGASAMKANVDAGMPPVTSSMRDQMGILDTAVADGVTPWEPVVRGSLNDIFVTVTNGMSPLPGIIDESMGQAQQGLSDGFGGMVETTRSGAGDILSEMNTVPPRINNTFSSVIPSMSSAGRSIMGGLVSGINAGAPNLFNTVISIASRVTNTFSSVLKINSPSRVIRDKIGVAIPEGLAAGIEKGAPQALASASSLANSVVDAASAANAGLSPTFQSTLAVTADTTSPIQVAADNAFDRVTAALQGWAVVLDPRGVATLQRSGAVLNGVR